MVKSAHGIIERKIITAENLLKQITEISNMMKLNGVEIAYWSFVLDTNNWEDSCFQFISFVMSQKANKFTYIHLFGL